MANGKVVQNAPSCLLQVEIVSITALNLARMERELDLHLQQVRRMYSTFTKGEKNLHLQQVRSIYIYSRWEEFTFTTGVKTNSLLQVEDGQVVKTS